MGHKEEYDSDVAHMVNNLPAVQEAWVQPLGREDPLEKEMANHSRQGYSPAL